MIRGVRTFLVSSMTIILSTEILSYGMPLIYRDGALAKAVDQLGKNVDKLTDKVDRIR